MDWFDGKNAIVTGAAHGIGHGIALRLRDLGARVIAVDRDEPALRTAFEGDAAIQAWPGDLAADDAAALADEICASVGAVELLVNNVGIDTPHGYMELSEEDYDLVFRTNLRGPWFFTRRIVAELIAQRRGGSVLFVSSLHDHIVRGRPHYSASKAALAMLVKEMARELGPDGIRVNAISPGIAESATVPAPGRAELARTRRLVPLRRIGQPDELAAMAAVLLSDEWSGYVTGVNVPVDGGLGLYTWSPDE